MSCLDPNSSNFDTLLPHFTRGLEEPIISKVFHMSFKDITKALDEKEIANFTGFLLQYLVSVIHHSDKLKQIARSNLRHPFNNMSVLNDEVILQELKAFASIEKLSILSMATGMPPHVEILKKLDILIKMLIGERNNRKTWEQNFSTMLKETINSVAMDSGQLTRPKMTEIMEAHNKIMKESFKEEVENIIKKYLNENTLVRNVPEPECEGHTIENTAQVYLSCNYSGKLGLHTCVGWEFPTCSLKQAWLFWLKGQPSYKINKVGGNIEKCPIRPFRLFTVLLLSLKKLRSFLGTDAKKWNQLQTCAIFH